MMRMASDYLAHLPVSQGLIFVDRLNLMTSPPGLFGYDGVVLEATESAQVVSVMLF